MGYEQLTITKKEKSEEMFVKIKLAVISSLFICIIGFAGEKSDSLGYKLMFTYFFVSNTVEFDTMKAIEQLLEYKNDYSCTNIHGGMGSGIPENSGLSSDYLDFVPKYQTNQVVAMYLIQSLIYQNFYFSQTKTLLYKGKRLKNIEIKTSEFYSKELKKNISFERIHIRHKRKTKMAFKIYDKWYQRCGSMGMKYARRISIYPFYCSEFSWL